MTTDSERPWGALAFVPIGLVLACSRLLAWVFVEVGPVAAGLFDAGQVLAVSVVASLLLYQMKRLKGAPGWLPWCGLSCLALCLGAFALPDDFDSFSRGQAILPQELVLWSSVVLASQSLVVAAFLGQQLNRPKWRYIALLACVMLTTANGLLLPNDYRGIHLLVAGSGLIAAGAAFQNAQQRRPSTLSHSLWCARSVPCSQLPFDLQVNFPKRSTTQRELPFTHSSPVGALIQAAHFLLAVQGLLSRH